MAAGERPDPDKSASRLAKHGAGATRWLFLAAAVAVVAFFVWRPPEDAPTGVGGGGAGAGPSVLAPPAPPRCQPQGSSTGYRIGDGAKAEPLDDVQDDAGVEELDLDPFAVELGRGDALQHGFAVGVRRDADGKTVAEVALVGPQADGGKLLSLDVARGDMDAPTVRANGKGFAVGMLEPNASGLALRLARFEGGEPQWGAELEQGRDESLALDFAFAGDVGVVVWDDITEDGKRGRVMRAVVKSGDLSLLDKPVVASNAAADAELPRVVPRPRGFWLAFVARKSAGEEGKATGDDGRYAAERIDPSWLELVPLDQHGKPEGATQAVTPQTGHVLGYDLMSGVDGSAIVVWRDDDTPSGAQGGRVSVVMVTASGGGGQQQLVADRNVGAGVPTLVPGWLAIVDDEGATRLAPMGEDGQVLGEPRVEPAMGLGQLVAAHGDVLLVAKPAGRAVDLITLECSRGE